MEVVNCQMAHGASFPSEELKLAKEKAEKMDGFLSKLRALKQQDSGQEK